MTNEEAINVLNDYDINFERSTPKEVAEAHEMAIKALEAQPSEDEKVIRISKGTLKARTGRFVIYDVEWLKEHYNTTEAKIYGQPSEDCISRKAVLDSLHRYFAEGFNEDRWWNSTHVLDAINKAPSITPQSKAEGARGDIPLQQSVPKMPQPEKHTEERTETHEYDYISRKDIGLTNLEILMCNGDYKEALKMLLDKIEKAPSATPQPKTAHWIGHREHCEKLGVIPSGLGVYEWCSNCGNGIDIRDWNRIGHKYCPECGAKMQEVKK